MHKHKYCFITYRYERYTMSTYVCALNLCIYVKSMNRMVPGNKQYNTIY